MFYLIGKGTVIIVGLLQGHRTDASRQVTLIIKVIELWLIRNQGSAVLNWAMWHQLADMLSLWLLDIWGIARPGARIEIIVRIKCIFGTLLMYNM